MNLFFNKYFSASHLTTFLKQGSSFIHFSLFLLFLAPQRNYIRKELPSTLTFLIQNTAELARAFTGKPMV